MRKTIPESAYGTRVRCYWNSHELCWSVVQKGKVIGHATNLRLTDVKPIISKAGQARVRRAGVKDTHAWLEGVLQNDRGVGVPSGVFKITYNPYKDDEFKLSLRQFDGYHLELTDKTLSEVSLDSVTLTSGMNEADLKDPVFKPRVRVDCDIQNWASCVSTTYHKRKSDVLTQVIKTLINKVSP